MNFSCLLFLQDLESARAVEVPEVYEPMLAPSGENAPPAEPVKPQLTEEDMSKAVQVSRLGEATCSMQPSELACVKGRSKSNAHECACMKEHAI